MEATITIFSDRMRRILYIILNLLLIALTVAPVILMLCGSLLVEGVVLNFQVPLPWIFGITNISKNNAYTCILKFLVGISYISVLTMCCIDIFYIIKNCVKLMKKEEKDQIYIKRILDINYYFSKRTIFKLAIFIIAMSFVCEITVFSIKTYLYILLLFLPLIKLFKDCLVYNDWKTFSNSIMIAVESTICVFLVYIMLDIISTPLIQTFFNDIGKFRAYNISIFISSVNTHFLVPIFIGVLAVKCIFLLSDSTGDSKSDNYYHTRLGISSQFRSILIMSLIFFAISSLSNAFLITNFTEIYEDTLSILKYFFNLGEALYLPVVLLAGAGVFLMLVEVKKDSLCRLIPKKYRNEEANTEDESIECKSDSEDTLEEKIVEHEEKVDISA